jgi:hypothetical protein
MIYKITVTARTPCQAKMKARNVLARWATGKDVSLIIKRISVATAGSQRIVTIVTDDESNEVVRL